MNIPKVIQSSSDAYRYARYNDSRMKDKIIEFYQEGKKNPSVAKVIASHTMTEYSKKAGEQMVDDIRSLRGKPYKLIINYIGQSLMALCRLDEIKKDIDVKPLYEEFEQVFKNLYPKTHLLREKLIQDERIVYGKTTLCMPKGLKKMYRYRKFF